MNQFILILMILMMAATNVKALTPASPSGDVFSGREQQPITPKINNSNSDSSGSTVPDLPYKPVDPDEIQTLATLPQATDPLATPPTAQPELTPSDTAPTMTPPPFEYKKPDLLPAPDPQY